MASEICNSIEKAREERVLILVLVEDGFRDYDAILFEAMVDGLNPCSCGRWLQSRSAWDRGVHETAVLILVLVEDGFRGLEMG